MFPLECQYTRHVDRNCTMMSKCRTILDSRDTKYYFIPFDDSKDFAERTSFMYSLNQL